MKIENIKAFVFDAYQFLEVLTDLIQQDPSSQEPWHASFQAYVITFSLFLRLLRIIRNKIHSIMS